MTDGIEATSLVEVSPSVPGGSPGLLDAIHRRWLERTEGGNDKLIAAGLRQQAQSDNPNEELCIDLVDGYIAKIGRQHVTGMIGEGEVYLAGLRAVQSYLATTIPEAPKKVTLWNVLGVIEEAFETDQPVSAPAPRPPIKIIRPSRKKEKPTTPSPRPENWRLEGLDIANQRRADLAEIRAGLREGRISLSEALENPSVERTAIADILIRVPKLGKVRRRAALKAVELAEETEVGAMDSTQKARLAAMFPREKHQPDRNRKSTVSREQAMESLKKANETRKYRAELKRKLATGKVAVEELFEDPMGAGMKLGEVIVKLPTRVGKKPEYIRSIKLRDAVLAETGFPSSKPLDQLTERQRTILLDRLSARYKEETGTYTTGSVHPSDIA